MVPPQQQLPDEGERRPPLLPTTGVDAASSLDLPYATDEVTGAVPTNPVLPPTFSAPRAYDDLPPPPSTPAHRGQQARAQATVPAPINAGRLADVVYDDDDPFSAAGGASTLPPMVAKGDWGGHVEGSSVPSAPTTTPVDADLAPPDDLRIQTDPFAPGPALTSEVAPSAAPASAISPSIWSEPSIAAPAEQVGGAPTGAPAGALAFSPDGPGIESTPGSPRAGRRRPSNPPSTAPAAPALHATIEPLVPRPDPRRARGPARIVSETRIGDGILVAAAAAAVAGLVWWAVVALTQRQFVYVAAILGVFVGQAALVGGRKGSLGLGLAAGAVTLLSLTATQYFITRSLAISELGVDWPLWEGTATFVDVIRTTFEDDPLTAAFVIGAAVLAGVSAGKPGARAAGSLGEVRAGTSPSKIL